MTSRKKYGSVRPTEDHARPKDRWTKRRNVVEPTPADTTLNDTFDVDSGDDGVVELISNMKNVVRDFDVEDSSQVASNGRHVDDDVDTNEGKFFRLRFTLMDLVKNEEKF